MVKGFVYRASIGDFQQPLALLRAEVALDTNLATDDLQRAAVLLAAGTPGKRLALPHARILLHQPYAQSQGQATDIELAAKEILRMRELLEEILAEHTGQPIEKIHEDTDRDFVLTAAEAQEYGIIDEVISARDLADKSSPITAVGS